MANSPLRLNNHFMTRVTLAATRKADISGHFEVDAKPVIWPEAADKKTWNVILAVEIKNVPGEKTAAYLGSVEFFGEFTVEDSVPEQSRELIVRTNGPSILYGAIREMVANLTARGPYPMFRLPSISFAPPEKIPSESRAATAKQD